MHTYDLVVVGSANADLVTAVERRPGAGETVPGSDLVVLPGGKGANQAVAAARLGARTALLARIGEDSHGSLLLESLRTAGVDTAAVRVGGAPTGTALITVDPTGENSIVVSPGANARLTPDDVRGAAGILSASGVVSAQLEVPLATVGEVVRIMGGRGRFVLNPSPATPLPEEILKACDPLIVNEHEARILLGGIRRTNDDNPGDWPQALLALGAKSVVVTLGNRGAVVAEAASHGRSRGCHVPAPEVPAVDTTGAGDAFAAALAWRLGKGDGFVQATAFAVEVAAVTVTRYGAQTSFPTAQDVRMPEDFRSPE